MKYQDIQISDSTLWQQIKQAWADGQYSTAIELLKNSNLQNKVLNADVLNALTSKLVEVQELNDPTYSADRIQVVRQAPEDMSTGEVYFEIQDKPYTWAELDSMNYTWAYIDSLNMTWADADKGGW